MAEQLKTFSVLIAWNDNDPEEGEYGWCGKAKDDDDAEDKARRAMFDEYYDDEDDSYDPDDPPFGRVIDLYEGITSRARSLEDALRLLVTCSTPEDELIARERANKILAEIDAM